MSDELWKIVEQWRNDGALIDEEEAESIYRYCLRKMEVAKTENQNREQYLPLLYADEIKNHLIRCYVNAVSFLQMEEEKNGTQTVRQQRKRQSPIVL